METARINPINAFDSSGRIPQVEYAIRNVSLSGTIVGSVCDDGILLVGINDEPSVEREKMYQISEDVYCAVCGIFSDCLRVVSSARIKAIRTKNELGVNQSVGSIAREIGVMKQEITQVMGMRPYGASILYAGMEHGRYALYSTDPSGMCLSWTSMCFGKNDLEINNLLKEKKSSNLELATVEVLKKISTKVEVTEAEADKFEILHYMMNGSKNNSRFLSNEEIIDAIRKLKSESP